ncbi:MAG: hypothetical protein WD336_05145, partial [Trueperaceae bacterium]
MSARARRRSAPLRRASHRPVSRTTWFAWAAVSATLMAASLRVPEFALAMPVATATAFQAFRASE